jgi:inner membrane protein
MNAGAHLLIGAGLGLAAAHYTGAEPVTAGLIVLAAAVGAVAPDIDHPGSFISRRLWPLRFLVFWLPHRGVTHSMLAVLLVAVGGWELSPVYGGMFAAGWLSHILADMLTPSGVPLLWPVRRRFRLVP